LLMLMQPLTPATATTAAIISIRHCRNPQRQFLLSCHHCRCHINVALLLQLLIVVCCSAAAAIVSICHRHNPNTNQFLSSHGPLCPFVRNTNGGGGRWWWRQSGDDRVASLSTLLVEYCIF
jgi:hypothetical protein